MSRRSPPCSRCTTGSAPPTINLENLDPEADADVVRGEARALPEGTIAALNDSFGFGGHNVVLAFRTV